MIIDKVIERIRLTVDKLLIRTKPMGHINQANCGTVLAKQIIDEAHKHNKNNGQLLWEFLPTELAKHVIDKPFDPYALHVPENFIRNWLWNHVVFDGNGYIIAVHDFGTIIACVEGCEREVDWFSRVRLDEKNEEDTDGRP